MPKFEIVTNEDVLEIAEEGTCTKETLRKRSRAMDSLKEFATSQDPPLVIDELIEKAKGDDTAPLEKVLELYFAAFRVGSKNELPKKNTVDVYRWVDSDLWMGNASKLIDFLALSIDIYLSKCVHQTSDIQFLHFAFDVQMDLQNGPCQLVLAGTAHISIKSVFQEPY